MMSMQLTIGFALCRFYKIVFQWVFVLLACCVAFTANAQQAGEPADIIIEAQSPDDTKIEEKIENIFDNIDSLANIGVKVDDGVVTLSGTVANADQADRAQKIVENLEGVVTVEANIEQVLDVESNVKPLLEKYKSDTKRWLRSWPVVIIAFLALFGISFIGHMLGKATGFWNRVTGNPFLGELLGQAIRVMFVVAGVVVALNLLGAKAMIGTVLGGAGVMGIAIGFAVRDSLENYISSIMLSLRQPFRANDRVMIGDEEGIVVRLTSRATILMTPEGNHLRIPNSTVFKAIITNLTKNPERRFDFKVDVTAEDDALDAMDGGLGALRALDFVLNHPKANGVIETVSGGSVEMRFTGWVNQAETDFGRARSLAILTVEDAVQDVVERGRDTKNEIRAADKASTAKRSGTKSTLVAPEDQARFPWSVMRQKKASRVLDVRADKHLEERASEDRESSEEPDLLDTSRPVE